MVRFYENTHVFPFTWDQVAQGFWRRYPNSESKHVLSEDTVQREIRGNKLFSKRLLTKTNRVPKWGECFVSSRTVKIVEESIVDPQRKVLVTYTRNIGYTRVMSIIEKVVYKESQENSNWTVAERTAWIDSHVFGFGRAIQAFGFDRFRKNCNKMIVGFNCVLSNMFPSAGSSPASLVMEKKEKTKDTARETAKKATELALSKSKTGTMYAACQSS